MSKKKIRSVLFVFILIWAPITAQSIETGGQKANLDLPYDPPITTREDDEEAPRIITFYSQQYEGDGIFFVIDKSGSMRDSGEIQIAKREVTRSIREFGLGVQFGIIFFSSKIKKFPPGNAPVIGSHENKKRAIEFVGSILNANGNSCVKKGMEEALRFSNNCNLDRRTIIYVGDGGGVCGRAVEVPYLNQTLVAVKRLNARRAIINVVGVMEILPENDKFLEALATGSYVKITR